MQYSQNYVAFIDILGFSNYVSNEENAEKTQDLFAFVEKFRHLYNTSPQLRTKVSFFSDSIVITSDEIESIILAIHLAESYLKKNLGLLFRGGICYGKYYHKNDITFGPAVISAYRLEQKAIYSRIIIDTAISDQIDLKLYTFRDMDGYICCNPYCTILNDALDGLDDVVNSGEDVTQAILSFFTKSKIELLNQIQKYKGTTVVDKYLWRVRPYNYTCSLVGSLSHGEVIFPNYTITNAFKEKLSACKITEEDINSL